jgi:aminoglycoside phosphotransferase (APT) family kinase protein
MHADEVEIDAALVRRLLAAQIPRWAHLPVERATSSGTDHAIYRLGDTLAVRLPRRPSAASQIEKEQEWLPRLAPLLPLAIPEPVALGARGEGYPFPWAIYRWLPGESATLDEVSGSVEAARALARFVRALQRLDAAGGPPPGEHNSFRGAPLAVRDARTRAAIASAAHLVDVPAVTEAWERALSAPAWDGEPVWLHGDLLPSNLLIEGGHLSGVIDFGMLGAGDPAHDVSAAWTTFGTQGRRAFLDELGVDRATQARARGWALSWALIALPYYVDTNPVLAGIARHAIAEVLADRE